MRRYEEIVDRQEQRAAASDARVLVAYATRNGSTQGVAERIATTLRSHGKQVGPRRVDHVGALERYDAVVFGSPV